MPQPITFEALGTTWWIEICDDITTTELEAIADRLKLLSFTFELSYSRFKNDSYIGILNRERILENPPDECQRILNYGKQLYVRSGGVFNLLVGHILEAYGYNPTYSFEATANASQLSSGNPLTDLLVSETEVKLTYGNIDLGGYGKGWLIDAIADNLREHTVRHFLINGGGDMYATSMLGGDPFRIYLEHPTEPGMYLLETTLLDQGFAASSPFKRQWKSQGKTYSHVITRDTTPHVASFVKARSATDADAFATVAMLCQEESLPNLAHTESLAIARFYPDTSQLWQTANFSV